MEIWFPFEHHCYLSFTWFPSLTFSWPLSFRRTLATILYAQNALRQWKNIPTAKTTYLKCQGRQRWLSGLSRCSHAVEKDAHHKYGHTNSRKTKNDTTNSPILMATDFSENSGDLKRQRWTVEIYSKSKQNCMKVESLSKIPETNVGYKAYVPPSKALV